MGTLGDVLEAIYEAPRPDAPLHVRATQMVEQTAIRPVHEWWMRQRDDGSGAVLMMATSGDGELGREETEHELWWVGPGRWRADAGDRVSVAAAGEMLTFAPGAGGLRRPSSRGPEPPWSQLLAPRWLFARFDLEVRGETQVAQRDAWQLELRPRFEPGTPPGAPLGPFMGQELSCSVDRETGIVVAIEGRFDGKVVSTWTTTELEVDAVIDGAIFDFVPPDGSELLTPLEFQVAAMLRAGVDLEGIDIHDEAQLHEAMMRHHGHHFGVDPEAQAEQHLATGPPPDDLDAAEAEVRAVFERIVTPSDDGEGVPAVQGGANLGPCLREAGARAPRRGDNDDGPATARVLHIKFLDAREAVVWFSLERGGNVLLGNMEGRARLDGDRWLVSRATFAHIVGSVGVRCPPPPES